MPSTHLSALFDRSPWFGHLPDRPGLPQGMLGAHESHLLYELAAAATGRGVIVDAGSFLGKSAYSFALGLRANPSRAGRATEIHCFDNFIVNESTTVQYLQQVFGRQSVVGDSTRDLFDHQTASVADHLVVHHGDFHQATWPNRGIEVLMVDIAKSIALGRKVVELFFPHLIPGGSVVVHQDYHHPWLPHIHVVMEFLSDCFELVAPRVDDSAAFVLVKAIPHGALTRAAAFDFTDDEQMDLMNRAVARLHPSDRHYVRLARVVLLAAKADPSTLRREFEAVVHDCREQQQLDRAFASYVEEVRNFVDQHEGWAQKALGNYERTLELVEGLLARGFRSTHLLVMRGCAQYGLGAFTDAADSLQAALLERPRSRFAYLELARVQIALGRPHEARDTLLAGIRDDQAVSEGPGVLVPLLGNLLGRDMVGTLADAAELMKTLCEDQPKEPALWGLRALIANRIGSANEAVEYMSYARREGLAATTLDQLQAWSGLKWTQPS